MRYIFIRRTYKLTAAVMVGLLVLGIIAQVGMARPNEQTVPTAPPPTATLPIATSEVNTPTKAPTSFAELTQPAMTPPINLARLRREVLSIRLTNLVRRC